MCKRTFREQSLHDLGACPRDSQRRYPLIGTGHTFATIQGKAVISWIADCSPLGGDEGLMGLQLPYWAVCDALSVA